MKNLETFCVQPWASYEYDLDSTRICCWIKEYQQDEKLRQELKQSLSQGIQHQACNLCWSRENEGIESRRQQKNMLADTVYDLNLDNLYNKALDGGLDHSFYQIETSNVCNGCCVSCGPRVSSKWSSIKGLKNSLRELEDFYIDYQKAKFIEFLGGEPFLDKINLRVMTDLIDAGNTDCIISIVTNGSIYSEQHIELLKKFRKVIVCFSIDGVGKTFEYLRWPLKWDVVEQNMHQIKNKLSLDNISINYTITNIAKLYYQETVEYFDKHSYRYFTSPVKYPEVFAYDRPIDILTQQEIIRQDQLKSISYLDYIPELEKYFV